ncbi:MAG: isocitrate lyase/phosphoenolpyruvate mutase family protein [Pseudomonadota bacterium]|nr:isocitrate lyase/phosphoenolpyruvate mutase family protein [Pseudomonadota bacterium]
MNQIEKAQLFQQMHLGPGILVIANAWDAASARVFEHAGVRAVGTGSAGVAFSHGYPDNELIPREVLLAATAEIVRAVQVPVTADILNGLGEGIDAVVRTVREVIALGAVGVNIEDASDTGGPHLYDAAEQAEKIRAVCDAVRECGVPIVVNARTDSFWLKLGDARHQLRESIARANRYREAGAHCLFLPSVVDRDTIKTLVAEIDGPLNILAAPGCPPVAELQELGVRRVSEGSGPMRACMMLAHHIARELLDHGTYSRFHEDSVPYAEANRLFS